jgi:hypothetical protein
MTRVVLELDWEQTKELVTLFNEIIVGRKMLYTVGSKVSEDVCSRLQDENKKVYRALKKLNAFLRKTCK